MAQRRLRSSLSDTQIVEFLLRNEEPAGGALQRLPEEQMKLLNLASDWLNGYLPHVLSRVNRVHYGLLSAEDLARLEPQFPNMPQNRKLLAVPFVAKDCPSDVSEFQHPDVVIGLTILAYRYER